MIACDDTFKTALMGARRVQTSTAVLTSITHATLGHAGTTMAAAKYGIKPIEPVADRGNKKLKSSAVTASTQRIRASVIIEGAVAGAARYMTYVHTPAAIATRAT
jgi:hypothetical protein